MTQAHKTHVIRVHQCGGPDVLTFEEDEIGAPGPGEVLLKQRAIGLNFIDTYMRSGLYPPASLPFVPGAEGAGVVSALGEGVDTLKVGDRVAYAGPIGAYAEERLMTADRLVTLPDGISDDVAAAVMLKGMTAQYLLRQIYPVGPQTTLLFHAAAGGVGTIACQWASALGAMVIGTVGSEEKAKRAHELGCAHVINYREEDFAAKVDEITGGDGVDVVYDSVGKDTFPKSLDCLKRRGLWVSFGQSSGLVPEFRINLLAEKGSLSAIRPMLWDYVATREELAATAGDLFAALLSGKVKDTARQRFPLREAAAAHRALESRQTSGSSILIP